MGKMNKINKKKLKTLNMDRSLLEALSIFILSEKKKFSSENNKMSEIVDFIAQYIHTLFSVVINAFFV